MTLISKNLPKMLSSQRLTTEVARRSRAATAAHADQSFSTMMPRVSESTGGISPALTSQVRQVKAEWIKKQKADTMIQTMLSSQHRFTSMDKLAKLSRRPAVAAPVSSVKFFSAGGISPTVTAQLRQVKYDWNKRSAGQFSIFEKMQPKWQGKKS
jgi:hypothetical protein